MLFLDNLLTHGASRTLRARKSCTCGLEIIEAQGQIEGLLFFMGRFLLHMQLEGNLLIKVPMEFPETILLVRKYGKLRVTPDLEFGQQS